MTDYRIDYISKPNHMGRIQAVGGSWPRVWRDTEDNAIKAISAGDTFHVVRGGYRVAVMVEWRHSKTMALHCKNIVYAQDDRAHRQRTILGIASA